MGCHRQGHPEGSRRFSDGDRNEDPSVIDSLRGGDNPAEAAKGELAVAAFAGDP